MVSVYHHLYPQINRFFQSRRFFSRMPRRASQLLASKARKGSGMEAARFRRAKDGPSKTLVKSEKRRIKAASGSPFLWLLSFGETKESDSPAGATTGFN
jgi:hypothetical protein